MKTQALIAATALTVTGIVDYSDGTTPDCFREDLLEAVASVTAWQMEYESIVPADARGEPVIHRIVGMKEPNCIYHWSSKYRHGTGMAWQDDPLQQLLIISGNRKYWAFPMRRAFQATETDDKNLFPGSIPGEFLWPVITWWPITRESNHLLAEEPYVVVDVLESDKYLFLKELEDVEGIQCYVLELPGRSALWFDGRRMGVLLAREFYNKDNGEPEWRIEMSKHKEIKPGIWCPMELRNIHYDYNAPTEEGRKRRVLDAAFKVLDVRLNEDVPDELFEIPEPKPGTIQGFEDGGHKQIVPGGYDYIDEIADWIKRNVRHVKPVAKVSATEIVCHIVVIPISLYIIFSCWRFRRGRLSDGQVATDSDGNDPAE
jgi:hypothetical protein